MPETNIRNAPAKPKQTPTEKIIIKLIQKIKSEEDKKNSNDQIKPGEEKWHKRITVFFTIVLTLATCGTDCIYWNQLSVQKLDQRAWLTVAEIIPHGPIGQPTGFTVSLLVSGKTPAIDTDVMVGMAPSVEASKIFFEELKNYSTFKVYSVIAPGINSKDLIWPVDPVDIPKVKNGRYYLCGLITYKDIWGGTHWTEFCETPNTFNGGFITAGYNNRIGDGEYK